MCVFLSVCAQFKGFHTSYTIGEYIPKSKIVFTKFKAKLQGVYDKFRGKIKEVCTKLTICLRNKRVDP